MNSGSLLQNYPHFLEIVYRLSRWLLSLVDPLLRRLGYDRLDSWARTPEEISKKALFDCRMCGQCVLHSTGMTCPMTCPKNIRNGPCGGVKANGHCEVKPEMKCVWVQAFDRSLKMPDFGGEILLIQPPLNRQLEGSSAWLNMLAGKDSPVPAGWEEAAPKPVIRIEDIETWKPSLSQTAA